MCTVTVRGEPHWAMQAINRPVGHCALHVGVMVLLARPFAGQGWKSLSAPRKSQR